jgi:hypothetical protein
MEVEVTLLPHDFNKVTLTVRGSPVNVSGFLQVLIIACPACGNSIEHQCADVTTDEEEGPF